MPAPKISYITGNREIEICVPKSFNQFELLRDESSSSLCFDKMELVEGTEIDIRQIAFVA